MFPDSRRGLHPTAAQLPCSSPSAAPSRDDQEWRLPRRGLLLGSAAAIGAALTLGPSLRPAAAATPATSARVQRIAAHPLARWIGDHRTYQALSASDLNPTGFHLAAATPLEVTVTEASAATHQLVVGAPDAEVDPEKRRPRTYELSLGSVRIEDPYGGPLYWKVIGDDGTLEARIGPQARRMPFYIHGTTTEAEFQEQLDERETPYVELVSDHALITIQREAALRFRDEDHVALLDTFEEIIAIEDELAGMDGSSPVHARLDHRFHFVTRGASITGVGAFATHGHMLFPEPIQDRLLAVHGLRTRGWGMYHELGHQHQQTVYKPSALTESTVNWYSLAVNRAFAKHGQLPRLHEPERNGLTVWESAPPKIGTEGVDFLRTFTIMEQLVMYEQLRLAYGVEVFQRVHRLVREEKPDPGSYSDNPYRLGMLVLYLSKATGNDLREYAAAWGIHYGAEFEERIAALELPLPEIDLTAVRDEEGAALAREMRAARD